MKRSGWLVACSLLAVLSACSKSSPGPEPITSRPAGPKIAQRPSLPDEPLAPPIAKIETPPPPPPAVAPAIALTDEPLAAPVDTRAGHADAARDRSAPSDKKGSGGSMWGAGVSKGASGGLGLSGVGEGGGGRGEGIGLGTVGTIGHGAGAGKGAGFGSGHGRVGGAPPQIRSGGGGPIILGDGRPGVLPGVRITPPVAIGQGSGVRTGEWDDNANFREFSAWIAKEKAPGAARLDLSARRFLVVRDSAGKPVPSCPVEIHGSTGTSVTLTTTATGRALLFPRAEGLQGADLVATAHCGSLTASQSFRATPGDGVVDLQLSAPRTLPEAQSIDVAFILDTTGSMSEEIHALRGTLEKVAGELSGLNVRPRVGLVEYRDRGDVYVTRLHQMTTDVAGLQARIAQLEAGGGGDTPEHVNEALRVAVRNLRFRPESVARLVFLIGDAPPHLDYEQDEGYAAAVKEANHAGVQIFTIAASGMDRVGQVVWRQIAQYTGGTNMFVLRGGAGPQSTGGGDPRSSCGGTHTDYTSDNLDALILGKVRAAVAARNADPLRIAGLNQDEKDRPCDQRIVMAQ